MKLKLSLSKRSTISKLSFLFSWTVKAGLLSSFLLFTLSVALWYCQERLLFHPKSPKGFETPEKNPKPYQNPGQFGMDYEDIYITTVDGVKLHAWFIKQKNNYTKIPTIIFFHGNAGNMGFRLLNLYHMYTHIQANILVLSYRGYGYSEGEPTEKGIYLDAEATLAYLRNRTDIDISRIVLFGRSVGGAVAIDLAFRHSDKLKAVMVENTFTSLRDMALLIFPIFRYFKFILDLAQRLEMNSLEKVRSIDIPMLFISGLQDTLVPPYQMRSLYKATSSKPLNQIYLVEKGSHNNTWQIDVEPYYQKMLSFLNSVFQQEQRDTVARTSGTCSTETSAAEVFTDAQAKKND